MRDDMTPAERKAALIKGVRIVAAAGKCNATYIRQVIDGVTLPPKKGGGSPSERGLGDNVSRAIEESLQLGRGWFDAVELDALLNSSELILIGLFRALEGSPATQQIVLDNLQETVNEHRALQEKTRALKPPPPDMRH